MPPSAFIVNNPIIKSLAQPTVLGRAPGSASAALTARLAEAPP